MIALESVKAEPEATTMDEIHLRRKDLANVRSVSWYLTEILQAIELPTKTEFRTVTTLTDAYSY